MRREVRGRKPLSPCCQGTYVETERPAQKRGGHHASRTHREPTSSHHADGLQEVWAPVCKVATPLKVIYARKPGLLSILMMIDRTADRGISLEPELKLLVFAFVDSQNRCSFCEDYRHAQAMQRRMGMERFAALADFPTSDLFTERERAALAYAEEAVKGEVTDDTFGELQRHFADTEIVELTWLVSVETYFNTMKRALDISSDGLRELAEERIAQKVAIPIG